MRHLAILLLMLTFSPSLFAEEIRIPIGQQGLPEVAMPARGESKSRVLDRFGLADEERPSVGQPPITRWDYREFSVYFEGDRVINSVRHHQRTQPTAQEESKP
ncbi:phosphodiesterase [Pseudomonas lopnurensis]|uniref:phosphodiesterase n=1 Tax=Pseudomonas lopnurensis TaxID=1477517 RepID=UPI0018792C4A|nr:phosphodiesterase [Pseudomonas lopnurensis]MBE7374841.1 phosphodiesterase [Pseudomonas lopnurensis]